MVDCGKGHYYDGTKYSICPYCNKQVSTGINVLPTGYNPPNTNSSADSGKTVSFYNAGGAGSQIEPVVGWLVCTDGGDKFKTYRLKAGPNYIGRGSDMDVCVANDNSVSRNKHAVVIYDPHSRRFFVTPGESRELFYVNDNLVLNNVELADKGIISIGKTTLRLITYCNNTFDWND